MRITDSQPPFSIGLAILVFYRHDWCIVFTRCFSTDNEHFISYHELPSDLKVSAILFHARCYQWLQCYVYVYWLYFYSHPIFLPLKCFIIQVVGPDTSSVNIEMCVWYIVFLFFMYLYLYFFQYIIHIIYMNTSLFLHVCRTDHNPLIELRAYGILTNDWQPRWADPRLQVRWTNIVWGVSRLGGLKHVSMNVHP